MCVYKAGSVRNIQLQCVQVCMKVCVVYAIVGFDEWGNGFDSILFSKVLHKLVPIMKRKITVL